MQHSGQDNHYRGLRQTITWLVSLFLCLFVAGCEGSYNDNPSLRRAGDILDATEISKEQSLEILDSLRAFPDATLSEGERHYRDFLMIKAADKGYITHISDSLYLTVKDYFFDHHRKEMLPEVLYYGGRVYSDMGVYPIALQYFRDAVALMGRSPADLNLRQRALSQTGRLLSALDLHGDALPYVEESIALAEVRGDTLAWIYDLQLAGDISDRINDYTTASRYFREVLPLSEGKYPKEKAFSRFRLGKISLSRGDTVAALHAFDTTISGISPEYRNYVLPVAAQAWLEAGNPDKAYLYAHELVGNPDPLNKKIGYRLLCSPGIRERLHPDTLNLYLLALDSILQATKKETMAETARLQHTIYNYQLHDRARQVAEEERDNLRLWLVVTICILMCLLLVFTWMALRRERGRNITFQTIAKRRIIERGTSQTFDDASTIPTSVDSNEPLSDKSPVKGDYGEGAKLEERLLFAGSRLDISDERELLIKEADKMCEDEEKKREWQRRLMTFMRLDAYTKIKEYLRHQKKIDDGDELWDEIREGIEKVYPTFMSQLRLLTEERMTLAEEHTAMLVKCGFGVKDMTILLGRAKGTIGSRRTSISSKIFRDKKGVGMLDAFLRAL